MSQRRRDLLNNVLIPIALAGGATGIRYVCNPWLGGGAHLLFHVLAVAVAAQVAGTASALVTTGLCLVLTAYFFMLPLQSMAVASSADRFAMLLFAVVGVFLSFFGGRQKRTWEALHQAYEHMTLSQEVARLGTFEWFVSEGFVKWSPEMEKIYGIDTPTRVHTIEEWKKFVYPEDRADAVAALEEAPGKQMPTYDHTFRIVRADGQVRWIHTRRKYQYDAAGKPLHMTGINIDITELKEGEMAQQILGGLVQVCSACRRIRDQENDEWYSMEGYLRRHSSARFSHGMCADCSKQWLSEE